MLFNKIFDNLGIFVSIMVSLSIPTMISLVNKKNHKFLSATLDMSFNKLSKI